MPDYWFVCPRCEAMGVIDADQANGRVSIQCATPGCDYHETGRVRPLIPSTTAVRKGDVPVGVAAGAIELEGVLAREELKVSPWFDPSLPLTYDSWILIDIGTVGKPSGPTS